MEKFDFEVVTEGSFEDAGYTVSTIVIRLNPAAMDEYITLLSIDSRKTCETDKEWGKYIEKHAAKRRAWKRKILEQLGLTGDTGYCIERTVNEIFTVVLFEKHQ